MVEIDACEKIKILEDKVKELQNEVSTLKSQQIEISKAKELYLKIFEDFPALIWRSRLDKLCDYFNSYWLEFTGRTMEQEFGNGWAEGVHPDDFENCLQIYVSAFDKREAFLMEYRLKNKYGEYRWIRDFGRPFYDLDNTFLGYIGSCYDITEIKETEKKLVELNATKDKLFSIIAHDLRSPFQSLIGLNDMVLKKIQTDDVEAAQKMLVFNIQTTEQVLNLLENLLLWSRSQRGRIEFYPAHINFKEIIDRLLNLLSVTYTEKDIRINVGRGHNLQLYADVNMFETIIRNLLSNAIKFTNNGGLIEILADEKDSCVEISVIDNGVGIPADKLESLFRIDSNYTTYGTAKEKGTGLGLVICKDFVERHAGKIWAESAVGEGTKFTFTIKQ
jgi:two-component system CheB/CheR fusion protein